MSIKKNKILKKSKLYSGGMILEVVLMMAIIMMVYPSIYRQTTKQKDKVKDILIVKEINTIKYAFEKFIMKYSDRIPLDVCNIDLVDLLATCQNDSYFDPTVLTNIYKMGLPEDIGKQENIFGQTYSVRIRKKLINTGGEMIEAMVIANSSDDGEPVDALQIRNVARELGFSGGYVDGNYIVGVNWEDTAEGWGIVRDDSLISKINPVQNDKSLLVRFKTAFPSDNTMLTDMFLNNNDLININDINIVDGKFANMTGEEVELDDKVLIKIENILTVINELKSENMKFYDNFLLSNSDLEMQTSDTIEFENQIEVYGDISATSSAYTNALKTSRLTDNLKTLNVEGVLNVKELSDTESRDDASNILKIGALFAKLLSSEITADKGIATIQSSGTDSTDSCKECVLYISPGGESETGAPTKLNDLVLKKLNSQLDGIMFGEADNADVSGDSTGESGVLVKYDTTLGMIIRALKREINIVNLYLEKEFMDGGN